MNYDNALITGKLRRWRKYLDGFTLPTWDEIPNFGLYMEQVTALLKQYLDYLPPELKEEQFITASTINNYVRMKVMPEPKKKRYYRVQIAYLIVICTLKQGLSLSLIQKLMPCGISDAEVEQYYTSYVARHRMATRYFIKQIEHICAPMLDPDRIDEMSVSKTEDLITASVVVGSFSKLLAEKLLLLDGLTLENGGSIEIE